MTCWRFFEEFIQKNTQRGRILYLVDKLETILQGLIYESEGLIGDVRNVCRFFGQISAQDQRSFEKTQSYVLADLWGIHFVERTKDFPEAELFLEILDVAVRDVRGEGFAWMEQFKT